MYALSLLFAVQADKMTKLEIYKWIPPPSICKGLLVTQLITVIPLIRDINKHDYLLYILKFNFFLTSDFVLDVWSSCCHPNTKKNSRIAVGYLLYSGLKNIPSIICLEGCDGNFQVDNG